MNRLCLLRNHLLRLWLGVGLIAFLTACSSNRTDAVTEKKQDSTSPTVQGAKKDDAEKSAAVSWKSFVGKVGDRVRVTREEKSVTTSVANFLGKDVESTKKSDRTVIHVTEILEAGKSGERPTKLRRTFEKAEETNLGKASQMPLHGKSVIVEKKGDTYAFTFEEGGTVTGPSTSEFEGEFNRKLDLTDFVDPGKEVKTGDTWDMKTKFSDTFLKPLFTGDKGSGACTCRKTYTKDGRLFGVVDGRMEADIVGVQGVPSDELRDGNRLEKEFILDRCIDGTSPEATSTTKMTFVSVFAFARSKIVTVTTSKTELLAK